LRAINAEYGTNFDINGIPPMVFAVITFSINAGAYLSENIRSALLAVDVGQIEACYSVNMSTGQALRSVIFPQAFTIALPSIGNNFISMLKETSLVFNISVVEIMAEAKIIGSRSFRFFEVYIAVSLIYWACCFVLERILNLLEKHVRGKERSLKS
jgi:ABC-type amino acid transport system permease subunit